MVWSSQYVQVIITWTDSDMPTISGFLPIHYSDSPFEMRLLLISKLISMDRRSLLCISCYHSLLFYRCPVLHRFLQQHTSNGLLLSVLVYLLTLYNLIFKKSDKVYYSFSRLVTFEWFWRVAVSIQFMSHVTWYTHTLYFITCWTTVCPQCKWVYLQG